MVIVPPLLDRNPGFYEAVRSLKPLENLPQMRADFSSSFLVLYPSEKDARTFETLEPQGLRDNKET